MRVEKIGSATLYHGDCLEVIPTLAGAGIDTICSDPPYGTEGIVGGYSRTGETILNDTNLDVTMAALTAATVVAPNALWAVFYSPRLRRTFYEQLPPALHDLGEIIWDKKAPGMGRGIRYQHETVALFYTGEQRPLVGDTFSVQRDYRSAERHPHQKPLSIITSLCEMLGGSVVLDPFLGSGTTGVACARLGRPFIGIELDPKHFVTACERIHEATSAPTLFAANDNAQRAGLFGGVA